MGARKPFWFVGFSIHYLFWWKFGRLQIFNKSMHGDPNCSFGSPNSTLKIWEKPTSPKDSKLQKKEQFMVIFRARFENPHSSASKSFPIFQPKNHTFSSIRTVKKIPTTIFHSILSLSLSVIFPHTKKFSFPSLHVQYHKKKNTTSKSIQP